MREDEPAKCTDSCNDTERLPLFSEQCISSANQMIIILLLLFQGGEKTIFNLLQKAWKMNHLYLLQLLVAELFNHVR